MVVVLKVLTPHFLTVDNLMDVARQFSFDAIIAIGMAFVIITGEIDLSVGSLFGLNAIIMGILLLDHWPPVIAILVVLCFGTCIGMLNGILVTKVGIPSFVTTLGMLSIGRGLALTLTGGWPKTLTGVSYIPNWFYFLGGGRLFGIIPMQAVIMIIAIIVGYFILHKMVIGYHLFAVGGNSRAATLYGISVSRVKIFAFATTGFLSALAGVLALSFVQSADPNLGTGMELYVIACAVVGGVSLSGGRGGIVGTFLGSMTIGILNNGLVLLGVSPYVQGIVIGAVVIGAVALSEGVVGRNKG
jgi:ribose transport system permease protein